MTPVFYKIVLKKEDIQYNVTTARRHPFLGLTKMKEELNRLVTEGNIAKFPEPNAWCALIVHVKQKTENFDCFYLKKSNLALKMEH